MDSQEINHANELFDRGLVKQLFEYISPFLETEDPYALYFYSRFSLEEWGESSEEFDKRSLELLMKAAAGRVPEALYRVALAYFVGDGVELDLKKGKELLDQAVELNCGLAKLSLAANHLYGANGYRRNTEIALHLAGDAESENVPGAAELIAVIKKE